MEEIDVGVTPAIDNTPASDPFVQQLISENNRLRTRNKTLEYRLARYERAYNDTATKKE